MRVILIAEKCTSSSRLEDTYVIGSTESVDELQMQFLINSIESCHGRS